MSGVKFSCCPWESQKVGKLKNLGSRHLFLSSLMQQKNEIFFSHAWNRSSLFTHYPHNLQANDLVRICVCIAFEIWAILPSFGSVSIPSLSEQVSTFIAIFIWNTLKPFPISIKRATFLSAFPPQFNYLDFPNRDWSEDVAIWSKHSRQSGPREKEYWIRSNGVWFLAFSPLPCLWFLVCIVFFT